MGTLRQGHVAPPQRSGPPPMMMARRTPIVARRSAGQVRPDEPLSSLTKEAAMCTTAPSGWASPRLPHARRPRWWLAGQPIPRLPVDDLRPATGLAPGGDPAQGAAAVPPIAQPKRPRRPAPGATATSQRAMAPCGVGTSATPFVPACAQGVPRRRGRRRPGAGPQDAPGQAWIVPACAPPAGSAPLCDAQQHGST